MEKIGVVIKEKLGNMNMLLTSTSKVKLKIKKKIIILIFEISQILRIFQAPGRLN